MADDDSDPLIIGGELRPGIRVCFSKANRQFDVEKEKEKLEDKLELKVGEENAQVIGFSADSMQAYVELKNESDINKVLNTEICLYKKDPRSLLVMKRFDLTEVFPPYLIVRELDDWHSEDILEDHLKAEVQGAKIESIEIAENVAKVFFANPQVALRFNSTIEVVGSVLQLEVAYPESTEKEEDLVLMIKNQNLMKIPDPAREKIIIDYISKHCGHVPTGCQIINEVGYLKFENSAVVRSIVSSPPTTPFYAKSYLDLLAVPSSCMKDTDDSEREDAISIHPQRLYSNSSQGSVDPNSSSNSGFARESSRDSFDSTSSWFESKTTTDSRQSRNSSSSSDTPSNPGPQTPSPCLAQKPCVGSQGGMAVLSTVPEQHGTSPGSRPRNQATNESMWIEDMDFPNSYHEANHPTRVRVGDVPYDNREASYTNHPTRVCAGDVPYDNREAAYTTNHPTRVRAGDVPYDNREAAYTTNHPTRVRVGDVPYDNREASYTNHPTRVRAGDVPYDNREAAYTSNHPTRVRARDAPGLHEASYTKHRPTTRVRVEDVPPEKRDRDLIKFYLISHARASVASTSLDCSVEQCDNCFVAIFNQQIDFQKLKSNCRDNPMGQYKISIYELEPTKEVFVSDIKYTMASSYFLRLHFEKFTGEGTVEEVKILPCNSKAYVVFKDSKSVGIAMENPRCREVEDHSISLLEYYDFMSPEDDPSQTTGLPAALQTPKYDWSVTEHEVSGLKASWVKETLQVINDDLKLVKARATVDEGMSSGALFLRVEPESGSEEMCNWEEQAKSIVGEYLDRFKEVTNTLPEFDPVGLLRTARSRAGSDLIVMSDDNTFTVAGDSVAVEQLMSVIRCEMIDSEKKDFPRKHVKYISKLCDDKLRDSKVLGYELNEDVGHITVRANEKERKAFWSLIYCEINNICEKSIKVEHEVFKLLASKPGSEKIEELIGSEMLVYHLEKDPPSYNTIFMSPRKDLVKEIKEKFKTFIVSQKFYVDNQEKLRLCSDKKWRELVNQVMKEKFVLVTVDEPSKSIIVSGEKNTVDDVVLTINKFLSEHTSVEERIPISTHQWTVMEKNFGRDIDDMRRNTMGVHFAVQMPSDTSRSSGSIVIRGDPKNVDDVLGKLKEVQTRVCHREVNFSNIPAGVHILKSLNHPIVSFESQFGASIQVSLKSDSSSSQAITKSPSMALTKLCSAICPNEVRISIYSGDFTKHKQVGAIINFVQLNPSNQDYNMKLLLASGGQVLEDDFFRRIDHLVHLNVGTLFSSHCGDLKCRELLHCFLNPWVDGKQNEEYFLETALSKALHCTAQYESILLTSVWSPPLHYPIDLFAKELVSLLSDSRDISSDMMVDIYVDTVQQASEFETQFKQDNCRVTTSQPISSVPSTDPSSESSVHVTRSIVDSISLYITVTKGDLLQQQADVYINSTNTNLDLKAGLLSKCLLKACGDELQKKCSEYAPLRTGDVAVTEVRNLNCDFIYHVALPDYKSDHNASRAFRTTIQAILRTAKERKAKSLAFPSLGVGNLNYPAHVSSKLLLEEIIAFHQQNSGCDIKYFLVIYEEGVFQEYNRIYTQKMNSSLPMKKKAEKRSGGNSTKLTVEKSDISEETTDVIVNTTTEEMKLKESAVSKALLKKAGPLLQSACDQLVQSGSRLDHGQIITTKSFGSLRCKKIIHAHMPNRSLAVKSGIDHFSLITDIVKKILEKTEEGDFESISIPAFGLGQGGYKVGDIAEPMLKALQEFGKTNPKSVHTIKIVILDQTLYNEFFDFFVGFFKLDMSIYTDLIRTIKSVWSGNNERFVELQDSSPPRAHVEPLVNSILSFNIYAPSKDKCDKIDRHLKVLIEDLCKEEPIHNAMIADLIDVDIDAIKAIGADVGVQLNVRTQIEKIEILGEKSFVLDAKMKITELLNDIEKSTNMLKQFEWQSENSGIEKYSTSDSFKLERAKIKDLDAIGMVIDGIEVIVDLKKMEERNVQTGSVRRVMRVLIKHSLTLPTNWEPQPTETAGKPAAMHMFDVTQGSPEYNEALQEFHQRMGTSIEVTVIKLQRIQNPAMYRVHEALLESMSEKYPGKKIDVRRLFHGSREESTSLIATQGFNRNFATDANAAYYGRGVYFAVNSSYSAQQKYSVPNKDGHQFMFVCRVIIGKYTTGNKDMKVAPPLQQGSDEVFDSLVENLTNPTIFVAMTDAQAYPDYLVTFKPKT